MFIKENVENTKNMCTYFFFLFMNKKKIICCEYERSFLVAIAPEHGIGNPI